MSAGQRATDPKIERLALTNGTQAEGRAADGDAPGGGPNAGFEADMAPAGPSRGAASRRSLGRIFAVVETLVLTLVIFFVVQAFIAQPFRVVGNSMERSFENGEYVLVDKLTPRWDGYHRGDVVVLNPPPGFELADHEPFIKRVIGLPGETVEIRDGRVWIDGLALDEPYTYDLEPTVATGDRARWVVGPEQLFVMGDHRGASEDSRIIGPIDRGRIIGRAWLRYWPLNRVGIVSSPAYVGATGPDRIGVPVSSPKP